MSEQLPKLLIATKNAGKLAEYQRLLGNAFCVTSLEGLEISLPEEGVESYRRNAEAKAVAVAAKSGEFVLGDDSGIEAFALAGQPGVISARFAGEPVSDRRNIEKLLTLLDAVGSGDRRARFVCWLALAGPEGLIVSVKGVCNGAIGFEPRGSNGFGYDPIFTLNEGTTMAELTDIEKDAVSHRGNAIRAMLPYLETEFAKAKSDV